MWLDAFKAKSKHARNVGVSGVSCVSPIATPLPTRVSVDWMRVTPEDIQGVFGVSQISNNPINDTTDTAGHRGRQMCQPSKTDDRRRLHAGDSHSNTQLTPLTHQKLIAQEIGARTMDTLARFRINPVSVARETSSHHDELVGVDNLAWDLMRDHEMEFPEAIRVAAGILAASQVVACEGAYADAIALFKRLGETK